MRPPEITGRRRPTKTKKQARSQKRKRDDVDVEKLEAAVAELDAKERFEKFADLPLSEPTKAGLKACHFSTLTDIQSRAIVLGLKGADILGAAKTGSGKTLAFLIPVLENLYRQQCIGSDAGLAAMIISPTRELAIQIFDVLRNIGKHGHMFAAGLVIGGKSLKEEQGALSRMNIVVCTPGRMLQHLSQTAAFSVDQLRMLVLDEADRIMDMGFQKDVDAIIDYLPTDRQTLLFSATQTKRVSDLARLSLREPEYVAVHEAASSATPKTLQQNYVITPLPTKLDTLWSFIQSAKKSKLLVFFSSAKQVRFVYESFRKLQPGIPLLHLHGRQRQTARLDITSRFSSARHSCLFATDVVARGLDFPAVDWVIQVDCPEDADTYIHRVGRTARYESEGRAVLFLDPTEEEVMLSRLAAKKVPIERINIRAKKQTSIKDQLQNMCFKDPELKYLGQKAFSSYVRSVHLQKDKEVFHVQDLELEAFAASIGLPGAPRIKFLSSAKAEELKALKNAPRRLAQLSDSSDDSDAADDQLNGDGGLKPSKKDKPAVRTKYDRMFERRNQDILSSHYTRMIDSAANNADDRDNPSAANPGDSSHDDEEDDLFAVKRRIAPRSASPTSSDEDPANHAGGAISSLTDRKTPVTIDSNRRQKALRSKKQMAKLFGASGSKLVFDADGTARPAQSFIDAAALADAEGERARFVEREGAEMRERDVGDREVWREKRRAKKLKRKERERLEDEMDAEEEMGGDVDDGDQDRDGGSEHAPRPFEELADLYDDSENEGKGDAHGDADGQSRPKRAPKWFERPGKTASRSATEPQTLEDLEALAAGLLD